MIVDTMVTVNQWGTRESVSNGFQAVMQTGWVGNMSVDPQYFVTKSGGTLVLSLTVATWPYILILFLEL